jgi:hypothetical protein
MKREQHRLTKHPLYTVWIGMKLRCYGVNQPRFKDYGGRGLTICATWRNSFTEFYKWAEENGWKPWLSIERKNNNKGYSPDNCCFIVRAMQARNRRTSKLTESQVAAIRASYDAGLKTNAELAKQYNITPTTMCKIVHRKIWKGVS